MFNYSVKVNQSLYGAFADAADKYPSNNALRYMGQTLAYRDVLQKIDALAANLSAMHLKKHDRVTICLPNIPDAVYWFYAVSKVGASAHLVHPLTTPQQLRTFLSRLDTRLIVALHTSAEGFFELASEKDIKVVSCNPSDALPLPMRLIYNAKNKTPAKSPIHLLATGLYKPNPQVGNPSGTPFTLARPSNPEAVLLHSGGTSGEPKTIALSDESINALAGRGLFILDQKEIQNKTMLSVLPMFHGFGMCMGIHALLCHGGCNAIQPKFSVKQTIKLLKKNRLNFLIGVPTLYEALLNHKDFCGKNLRALDVAFVGGDFVPHALMRKADQRFAMAGSHARLFEGYGLTETVTVCAVNTHRANRTGSVGQALPGIRIEAADESGKLLSRGESGELFISGDTLMSAYLNNAAATAETFFTDEDGVRWVKTGDYGYVDADGFVFFRQRIKRIVKVSGISVYPFEIEQLVSERPLVRQVCALDVPDAKHGSMIRLFVAAPDLNESDADTFKQELVSQIGQQISVYAVPRDVVFLKKLPTTSVGKVNVEQLRRDYPNQ